MNKAPLPPEEMIKYIESPTVKAIAQDWKNSELHWDDYVAVKKKELSPKFQILSFKHRTTNKILSLTDNKRYSAGPNAIGNPKQWFLDASEIYAIYSVKRLSDEVVFTIGDYVYKVEPNYAMPIAMFTTSLNQLVVWADNHGIDIFEAKIATKILTTEDGTDVYNPSRVIHCVNRSILNVVACSAYRVKTMYSSVYYLYFDSVDKAHDYIASRQRVISIHELEKLTIYPGSIQLSTIIDYINKKEEANG